MIKPMQTEIASDITVFNLSTNNVDEAVKHFTGIDHLPEKACIFNLIERGIIIPEINEGLSYLEDKVSTEQFVALLIRGCKGNIDPTGDGWSSGYLDYAIQKGIMEDYDMTNIHKPIERRSAARIVHEAILTELGERDELEWSVAENLKDLYSCHTCVRHIAQVYVKGIMLGRDNKVFDVKGSITRVEAATIIIRMLDRAQRIPQTGVRELQSIHLSQVEAWQLMQDDSTAMLIDVRTNEEYDIGHVKGSINIPLLNITINPFSVCVKKDTPIILYCQKGYKSSIAGQVLSNAGYSRIYTIPGIDQYE